MNIKQLLIKAKKKPPWNILESFTNIIWSFYNCCKNICIMFPFFLLFMAGRNTQEMFYKHSQTIEHFISIVYCSYNVCDSLWTFVECLMAVSLRNIVTWGITVIFQKCRIRRSFFFFLIHNAKTVWWIFDCKSSEDAGTTDLLAH